MAHRTFRVGDLTAIIGDNGAHEQHRAGYNGLWSLTHRTEGIRFTHSPSGGGSNAERQTTNPAWDFQYLIPKYEVKREYRFRARLAYRPRCSRAEILQEVAAWRKTLK